ncbi:sigma-54 interaction domain-containing protein [Metabacillus arenae]|uniref:Sigma 54-interacting transcriptional regulator n=1 Tax=Metabacillus arenae TaxID=2771434 RepID=A0A926NKB8_9BACI|nr:sigma 54-interacting transcriptional regulator [Metabacillus arenae]MBD1382645.1 sigma 54-interacting transcriptional regulator [Metabacillus arenae]
MFKLSEDYSSGFILEKQIEWWKAIVYSINDGILVIDHQGFVRHINPEYTQITGVTPDIIGKRLKDYRPGAQLPETLADKKCRVGVYRKTDNREYIVDMAPIIVNDKIIGAVSVCKSLTEVHKLSQELKKKGEKLEQLQKKMNSLYQAKYTFKQIIGRSGGLREAVYVAERVAESDLAILITGESGTGKELFAQAIHNESSRKNKPFIPVNCAAIPSTLLESELFGYGDGAFTNAKKGGKIGLFEIANNGTIFLDEIGDMSYDLQAKLLRVLQERKIRRVGETAERSIDVRIIAATHRDLQQLVKKNRFREDLFYRLNVIRLQVPPLRERKEDIPDLVNSMLHSSAMNLSFEHYPPSPYTIDRQTLKILLSYEWPGNVRELKNVIDYASCMAEGTEIKVQHLPELIMKKGIHLFEPVTPSNQTLQEAMEEAESKFIQQTLKRFGSDIEEKKKAAKALGISLATLYNKLKRYHIDF